MSWLIVHDDHVAKRQCGHHDLFDVSAEGFTVHRTVQHHRRGHAARSQRTSERGRLPVTVRNRCTTTLAAFGAPTHARNFCRRTVLVDEDQAHRMKVRLVVEPRAVPRGDV